MTKELNLISMKDVQTEEVQWLWYPYIPFGKITIIQGDPGEGKTTFVLAMIALLTKGEPLPEQENGREPLNAIYQTAEDGLGDTIKPRLELFDADCSRVLVIDEGQKELTLNDERLEEAIRCTKARLIVLDPIQAFLGSDTDMHRANEIRPLLKRMGAMAERTGCAVVLIGHMNKAHGQKSSYRGLGSIDFRASARSVLVVGRLKETPQIRVVAHDKSSLSPEGQSMAFEISPDTGFRWKGFCDTTVDQLLSGYGCVQTKTMQAEQALRDLLEEPKPAVEVQKQIEDMGISSRTLSYAKKNLGVLSTRKGGCWQWYLPPDKEIQAMSG